MFRLKIDIYIGPDKQTFYAYNCEYFLIHQFKQMFWVSEGYSFNMTYELATVSSKWNSIFEEK